jgi:hypothetical protein
MYRAENTLKCKYFRQEGQTLGTVPLVPTIQNSGKLQKYYGIVGLLENLP